MIAAVMLVAAAIFTGIALGNPQAGFPWSNIVTYTLYGIYIVIMIVLFAAPFRKAK